MLSKETVLMKVKGLIILITILSFSLSGCGSGTADSKTDTDIMIWHWMTDREDAFNKLAEKYQEETGLKVRFELYAPSEAYTQKIRAAAQTDTLPDVYGVLGEARDFASFIKAGYVAELSEEMDANNSQWRNQLFNKALEMSEFLPDNSFEVKPGIYGVPIDVTNIQFLYNKNLFRKAGLDPENPPSTFEQFLEAGSKLKAAGIQGLVSGWGEVWMIDCLASNFAFNIMGENKVIETIKGKVPYTDPDWIKVFDLFRQMRDAGILAKGMITMVNKTAEQMFANERAAFAFNGSWCVNVYNSMNPDLDYGVILPPKVSDKYPMKIWGGAGSTFVVNNNSDNKDKAINFLKWMTAKPQQILLAEKTKNLPSNKESLKDISSELAQFADDMEVTTHPSVLPVVEYPAVIEAFDKGIQSIIIGEKTPEQLAAEVQKIKEREIQKNS